MIELNNVAMSYGGRTLFKDVALSLAAGSFHFLTGPSGAGKTTLLKLCSLELAATEGRVALMGQDVSNFDAGLGFQGCTGRGLHSMWTSVGCTLYSVRSTKPVGAGQSGCSSGQ